MSGAYFERKSLDRWKKAVKAVPEKVFNKHVGKASGKAMTPVSISMKRLAPKEHGDYRKSIGKKRKTYKRNLTVWTGVGPRRGKYHANLAHLLEYGYRVVTGGTTARIRGKRRGQVGNAKNSANTGKGRVVGFVGPRLHIKQAMRNNRQKVRGIYKTELRRGIMQEARAV